MREGVAKRTSGDGETRRWGALQIVISLLVSLLAALIWSRAHLNSEKALFLKSRESGTCPCTASDFGRFTF